tara:strand:+ start:3472 stop:4329 length:858 start_codon:yes stop_codon:yes gene_type:complete
MVKRKSGKKFAKTLKKFSRSPFMNNPTTQYIVLLVAIAVVLFYLSKKDYNSLIMLIATGLLTNYFTKNMTITLGVAIIGSLIVRMKITQKEGFEEGAKGEKKEKKEKKGKKAKTMNDAVKEVAEQATDVELPEGTDDERCWENKKGVWNVNDKFDKDECTAANDKNCFGKESICTKKQGFAKRLIPSSQPATIGDEDEVDTDRIDYAKTLEQAYDNLQGMLGKEGISGLTSETSRLVEQQSSLMSSLKGMGPMLKEAKSMMAGMKDMGTMDTMKDMKSLLSGIGK